MIDLNETARRLQDHLAVLTVDIGERSIFSPHKLAQTAEYIEGVYAQSGLAVEREEYRCGDFTTCNVVAFSKAPQSHLVTSGKKGADGALFGSGGKSGRSTHSYLVGAHYDCVRGTVGADDNASAVAVQLEVARQFHALRQRAEVPVSVKFVSFALEEYPAYGTDCMGSLVHAKGMKARRESIDGMICLEMVGYSCLESGCQKYPPLLARFYPGQGDFIGVVGNTRSRKLVREIRESFAKNLHLPVQSLTVPLNGWVLPAVRRSDHVSFWSKGFKAVMITDTAFFRNPNYHLPSDRMETLDIEFMAQVVASLLLFLLSG